MSRDEQAGAPPRKQARGPLSPGLEARGRGWLMTAFVVMAIALGASAATMLGGLAALRLSQRLYLVLGFSAGAVIAVAFFDLLPEALALKIVDPRAVVSAAALGFFLYLLFDRLVSL